MNVRVQRETVDRLHDAGLEQALGETGFDSLGGYRTGEHGGVRIVLADDARRIGDQPDVVLGESRIVWVLDIPLVPDLVMRDATPELLRDECDVTVERGANRLATRLLPAAVKVVAIAQDEQVAELVRLRIRKVTVPVGFDLELIAPALQKGPVRIGSYRFDTRLAQQLVALVAAVGQMQVMGADADDEGIFRLLCRCLQGQAG